jgi:aminoglycoside phosphotransferase (APT) family kinase protein
VNAWFEEHRKHLESRPSAEGLRRMARTVAPGSHPVRITRLRGGLGASTHRVTLERRSGRTFDVVLKRSKAFDSAAEKEWHRICFAATLPVTSPEPVALDADGTWFGAPALVMSFLPGRPELGFDDDGWRYARIAEAILATAAVPTSRMPKRLKRPPFAFEPPKGLRCSALVERAIAAIEAHIDEVTRPRRVMTHGDLHPGNMLWSRHGLSGLVDWFCLNHYLEREVVYCRTELAVLFGAREADRFLDTFERVAGRATEHMPVWDLMQGLTAMRWVKGWAYAYREQGRKDLTDEIAVRRARTVVERALATCSS